MTGLATISAGLMTVLAATTTAQPGSVPPDTADPPPMTDIHDIKPILDLGGHWPWGMSLLVAALALLLLALAWWFWKRRRRPGKQEEVVVVAVAPDQEALAALDALTDETGLAPRQFYFRLSAILRRYIERRYHFPAAEMTTEELLPHLDRLPLDSHLAQTFKAFCREADPIKFAGAASRREQVERNLAFCRDFVRSTTTVSQDDAI
ncbi:MAG: DUF4381 family protein [Desulfobacteraceae bacterium]